VVKGSFVWEIGGAFGGAVCLAASYPLSELVFRLKEKDREGVMAAAEASTATSTSNTDDD